MAPTPIIEDELDARLQAQWWPSRRQAVEAERQAQPRHDDFADTYNHKADAPRRANRVPRIPRGCNQQGRHPQAAECATDVGADDTTPPAAGMAAWLAAHITPESAPILYPLALLAVVGAVAAVAVWWRA